MLISTMRGHRANHVRGNAKYGVRGTDTVVTFPEIEAPRAIPLAQAEP